MNNNSNEPSSITKNDTDATPPRRIGKWKSFVYGVVACAICVSTVFSAFELTFRSLYAREKSFDWLRFHPTRLYVNNPDRPAIYWNTQWNVNSWGLRGPEIGAKTKPRIFCLGDSSTFGYRASYEECYPGRLQTMLPEFEVINGGTFGYSSFQGLKQFVELAPQIQPDIVTLAFNTNDRRYVVRPDLIDCDQTFAFLYRQYSLHVFLIRSRFYQVLMHENMLNRLRKHPPVTTLLPRVNTRDYQKNLETIIQTCRRQHIQVILIGIGDHPEMFRLVEEGALALARGEWETAIELFQSVRDDLFSVDAKVIATALQAITLQAMGRFDEADAMQFDYPTYYHFPGVNPIRTTHSYFRALRMLGEQYALPVVFYRELIHDDPDFYIDTCHPSIAGYELIAETLKTIIQEKQNFRK
jgi:lysophospholipase L1-like esterase